jgi:3-oxoacyl-[acyl-carrier protein] reductase
MTATTPPAALITGAASGIGAACAALLRDKGWRTAGVDLRASGTEDAGITLDEMRQRYRELVPVGQLASPEDIAGAVAFLASPGAGALVGQVLQPSGGVTRTRA